MMTKTEAQTHRECTSSLRGDRAAGLMYGPYAIQTFGAYRPEYDAHGFYRPWRDKDGDEVVLCNSTEFAAVTGKCTYCGAQLPRGRRLYLLRYVPKAVKVCVALAWRQDGVVNG